MLVKSSRDIPGDKQTYNEEEVRILSNQSFNVSLPILLNPAEPSTILAGCFDMPQICPRNREEYNIYDESDGCLGKRRMVVYRVGMGWLFRKVESFQLLGGELPIFFCISE